MTIQRGGVEWPGASFDAGPFFADLDDSIEHRFTLQNRGDEPVRIREIRTSCTCTEATLSTDELGPGEHAELRLVAEVPRIGRDNRVFCTLETDHPTHPLWTYELHYRSYPRIGVEGHALDLGTLEPGTGGTSGLHGATWVDAYAPVGESSLSLRVDPLDGPLRPRIEGPIEEEQIEGGAVLRRRYRLVVELLPGESRRDGAHAVGVTIRSGEEHARNVSVTWRQTSALEVTPNAVFFGSLGAGADATRTVTIRSRDGRAFRLRPPSDDHESSGWATVALSDCAEPSTEHEVSLGLDSAALSGKRAASGEAIIQTDHPDCPEIRVPWSAFSSQGRDADLSESGMNETTTSTSRRTR